MIIEVADFITDQECFLLNQSLSQKLIGTDFGTDPFYHWIRIEEDEDLSKKFFFKSVVKKQLDYLNSHVENRNWVIEYYGFAHQTKGFPYHADAVWPEEEEHRSFGDPTPDRSNFKNYVGPWVGNYVPLRHFTTVLYLNDVEGGETDFPVLDRRIKVEKKKLAGFHCDEHHIHGVLPTTQGIRNSLIFWYQ